MCHWRKREHDAVDFRESILAIVLLLFWPLQATLRTSGQEKGAPISRGIPENRLRAVSGCFDSLPFMFLNLLHIRFSPIKHLHNNRP